MGLGSRGSRGVGSIRLDRDPQPTVGQLCLKVFRPLFRRPRNHGCSAGVHFVGVLMRLLGRHAGDDSAERHLDVVERVTATVQHDDAVWRQCSQASAYFLVQVRTGNRWADATSGHNSCGPLHLPLLYDDDLVELMPEYEAAIRLVVRTPRCLPMVNSRFSVIAIATATCV